MKNIYEIRNNWFIEQVKKLEESGIMQVEIANKLDIKPQYLNAILHGRQNASEKFTSKFCSVFNINANTLLEKLSGYQEEEHTKVKTFIEGDNKKKITARTISGIPPNKGIPLIALEVAAGFGSSDFVIKEQDIQEYYVVPDFNGIDFMIRVKGNSMNPTFSAGDIIACRKINERGFIQWNKCHMIATREQGLLVKRLKKASNENSILAVSDNKEYDPFEIPKEEITGIALVIGMIRLE